MSLDFNALKNLENKLKSGYSDRFMYANKDIGDATDIRILPPVPEMNGMYFMRVNHLWVETNDQFIKLISASSFGEECIIQKELDEVKHRRFINDDYDLDMLLNNLDKFNSGSLIKSEWWLPVLHLDCDFNNEGECVKMEVVGGKPKILVCKKQLLLDINRIVTSRNYQNGTPDGILDRVKGFNIICTKGIANKKIEYSAEGWRVPMEMDMKYYENLPNMIEEVKNEMYTPEYTIGVLRSYFYGEQMPDEDTKRGNVKKDVQFVPLRGGKTVAGNRKRGGNVSTIRKSSNVGETKSNRGGNTSVNGGNRNLMDDLNNLD